MAYTFLEHTADVRVECRGKTIEELFVSAAQALYAVALEQVEARGDTEWRIEIRGADRDDLLVRWLQELLYLLDTQRLVGVSFEFASIEVGFASIAVAGYRHGPGERAEEVKAATYHGASIRQCDGDMVVELLFDL